jgi:hypothetical protein
MLRQDSGPSFLHWMGTEQAPVMADQSNNHALLYVDSCESSLRAFRLVCGEQFRVLTASSGLEGPARLNQHKDEIGVVVVARYMPIAVVRVAGTQAAIVDEHE